MCFISLLSASLTKIKDGIKSKLLTFIPLCSHLEVAIHRFEKHWNRKLKENKVIGTYQFKENHQLEPRFVDYWSVIFLEKN
jgi:hypothetical protein